MTDSAWWRPVPGLTGPVLPRKIRRSTQCIRRSTIPRSTVNDADSRSWALVSVRVKSNELARATAFARQHQFDIGKPLTFDGEDEQVSAMEMLAASAAADLAGVLRKVARERRVEIDELEVTAQGELNNALVFLGVVGEDGEPSLKTLRLKVYLSTGASESEVQDVWDIAQKRSPLITTLRRGTDLQLELQIFH